MKITVQVKTVYGKNMVYPICDNGILFAKLANSKTLTPESIKLIKQLGYAIELQQDEFKELLSF